MTSRNLSRIALFALLSAFLLAAPFAARDAEAQRGRGRGNRSSGHGYVYGSWNPWWSWGWGAGWAHPSYQRMDSRLRAYGFVDIDVDPEEAEVLLDGKSIGTADDFDGAPDYLLLRPGRYTLEFRLPGFESWSVELDVRRGRLYPLDTELERLPGIGRLEAGWGDDTPPAARRWAFGKEGSDDDFDEDEEDLPLRRYEPWSDDEDDDEIEADDEDDEETVEPEADQEEVTIDSEVPDPPAPPDVPDLPDGASISIAVEPKDAVVWLDGIFLGEARDLDGRIETTPGEHELVVMKSGFETRVLSVDVSDDAPSSVVVTLEERERSE